MSKQKVLEVPKKKFVKPTRHLSVGLGVVFEGEIPEITSHAKGVSEVYIIGSRIKCYLDLNSDTVTLGKGGVDPIEVPVPEKLRGASYGEILLNNNRSGARVLFGRNKEDDSFGFGEDARYISLRFYAQENLPDSEWEFDPLYVRIDKGSTRSFLCLTPRWENDVSVVEIYHDVVEVDFPFVIY